MGMNGNGYLWRNPVDICHIHEHQKIALSLTIYKHMVEGPPLKEAPVQAHK